MTHAEMIKRIIAIRNITPAELSRRTGINKQTIYTILRNNQKRTNPNIYIPLALELNIPEYYFKNSQNITINELDDFVFSVREITADDIPNTYLIDLMKEYNRSPEFILNGVSYISTYSKYSTYDIKTLLVNAFSYDHELGRFLENLIKYGLIVTRTEYHFLEGIRQLDKNRQQLLYDLLSQLILANTYNPSLDEGIAMKPFEKEQENIMSWNPSWKKDD